MPLPLLRSFAPLGDFLQFCGSAFKAATTRRLSARGFIRQMDRVGVESLSVINLCAFFISLVLVIQMVNMLSRFGAKTEVSSLIGVSFVREIGPVFAAIMFTGRIGTGMAAELASMLATEQIDALRVMGANPMSLLVVPRVLASVVMLPALTAVANLVGIFSGYLGAMFTVGISPGEFARKALEKLDRVDITASIVKPLCFGLLIGLVATYMGLRSEGTTESVGKATTRTMVVGVLGILGADFVLTKIFLGLAQ